MKPILIIALLAAQTPHDSLPPVMGRIRPQSQVRAQLRDGRRATGALVGRDARGFTLQYDTTRFAIRHEDVTRIWQRDRAIGAGALVGGGIGAAAGVFLGLVVYAVCEGGCGDDPAQPAAVGGALVGAAGAVGGAIIGAAIPRWRTRWASGPAAPGGPVQVGVTGTRNPPPVIEERRRIGEFSVWGVAGGGGFAPDTSSFMPSGRGPLVGLEVGLAFRAGPFALGPEASALAGEHGVRTLGGVIRLNASTEDTRVAPYLVAGAGAQFWRYESGSFGVGETSFFTGIIGGGVMLGARQLWRVEARWHPVLEGADRGNRPRMVTIAGGRRITW